MNSGLFPAKKSIGLLLDPDKAQGESLKKLLKIASDSRVDYIFTGGSLSSTGIDDLINQIKINCDIPVVLFPGNLLQLNLKADIILFLSLISGRNPEFLIGNHVIAAPFLRNSKEKIVSVGYILIACGNRTSVEYISQTGAIPCDKTDIVVATALAGEMLGLKMIYLEAGSGADHHIPAEIIKAVKENVSIPVVVGGGLRKNSEIEQVFHAGADLVILGNGCEENAALLGQACMVRDRFRKKNDLLV